MQIKMYYSEQCPYCRMALNYFIEKGLKIQAIKVTKSNLNVLERETNQLGIPVITIDNKTIIGYDRNVLNEILGFKEE